MFLFLVERLFIYKVFRNFFINLGLLSVYLFMWCCRVVFNRKGLDDILNISWVNFFIFIFGLLVKGFFIYRKCNILWFVLLILIIKKVFFIFLMRVI